MTTMVIIFCIIVVIFSAPAIFLTVWLIRKSTRKLSAQELIAERIKLEADVDIKMPLLSPFSEPEEMAHSMDASYSRGFAITSSGVIKSRSGNNILAYSAIQRGIYTNKRIILRGVGFSFYIEAIKVDTKIELNGMLLGYTNGARKIFDANRKTIGYVAPRKHYFEVFLNRRIVATINYRETGSLGSGNLSANREASYNIVDLVEKNLTEEEKLWIICLTSYEMIANQMLPPTPTIHRHHGRFR